ncbi:prolyl 3-hydroxylase 1-like, partial [Heterodontus francisci]|uniref:prolyl 3-hydroxylase 1-like n=1 Tax=Heterodontus francisci TaxID=7792 RepID=UPI00355B7D74
QSGPHPNALLIFSTFSPLSPLPSLPAPEDSWTPTELIPRSIQQKLRAEGQKASREAEATVEDKAKEPSVEKVSAIDILKASSPVFANLKVVMDSHQLNGSQRVVLDGVLTHAECAAIRRLANAASQVGDHSRDSSSLRPPKDRLTGLSLLKALTLARDGIIDRKGARLYHEASGRAGAVVQSYFHSRSPVHRSFSHLACRTPLSGLQGSGTDQRHPVPGEEACLVEPETAACWETSLSDADRDFSAFLYLNDEFEGGETFFTDVNRKTVRAEILPKCGRLVTFLSGTENPHGVQPVIGGQRCALVLWFTLNEKHNKKARAEAQTLMAKLFPPAPSSTGPEGVLPPHGGTQGEASGRQPKKTRMKAGEPALTEGTRPQKDEL